VRSNLYQVARQQRRHVLASVAAASVNLRIAAVRHGERDETGAATCVSSGMTQHHGV